MVLQRREAATAAHVGSCLPRHPNNTTHTHIHAHTPAGAVSTYLPDELLSRLLGALLGRLAVGSLKPDITRTYVQAVGQVRKGFALHLHRMVGYAFELQPLNCIPKLTL